MTEKLTRDMIEAARTIAEKPGSYWTDQLNNTDQLAAYHRMGEEIWAQTDGQIDAFVQSGAHKIDGVGAGFVVPLWREDIADEIEQVSTEEAASMALRLAREEGLFAGTSTGGNVVAALRLAERLGPEATIVTVMCDSGMKYLSSALYRAHTSSYRAD